MEKRGTMERFIKDFKTFVTRGNIMELAIAVIIGTAFNRVVQSLVNDVIMPVLSLITGKEGFDNYKYVITAANEEEGIVENAIYYGKFIQHTIDFIFMALVVFVIYRIILHLQERMEEAWEEKKKEREQEENNPK
jgi:large conductance mechanosensitive channel